MVSSRKRALRSDADVGTDGASSNHTAPAALDRSKEPSLLQRIRSMWQFSNLYQWIYLFGKVVKIDEGIDIDDLEAELLKHNSPVLIEIGLALLRFVSSHRGLTPDLFDEYTRRQYVAKLPDHNPFGIEEVPVRFNDFDAFTKIRVLQQLTRWVMLHPERIREKMDEQKPTDQTEWRIEPYGWDGDDRTYYVLDDNRIYRKTDPPAVVSEWKPKRNTKKAKAAARAAKRRRVSRSAAQISDDGDDEPMSEADHEEGSEPLDDGLGGAKWECIATNLDEVQQLLGTLRKSRDENEKVLKAQLQQHLIPILEKQEESRKRKALQREKELLNLEKMAHAKRSSRIAQKIEQTRHDEQVREEEERRHLEEAAFRKEEQKRLKLEKERDNRLMSRENRLREREARRLQHEEELAQLSEDSKNLVGGTGRLSERRLKAEIEKNQQALRELEEEEDDWIFDCVCGVYGQIDDGTHSVACERCNVWQHSKCLGISEDDAERDDFHFVCKTCRREDMNQQANSKPTIIKLKVSGPPSSSSPTVAGQNDQLSTAPNVPLQPKNNFVVEAPTKSPNQPSLPAPSSSPPTATQPAATANGILGHPIVPVKPGGTAILPPPSPYSQGEGANPFSSPHPTLSPPEQSPNKSRVYSTLYNQSSPIAAVPHPSQTKPLPPKGVFQVSPKLNGAGSPHHTNGLAGLLNPTAPAHGVSPESPVNQPVKPAGNILSATSPGSRLPSLSTNEATSPGVSGISPIGQRQILETPRAGAAPALPPMSNGKSPSKRSPPPVLYPNSTVQATPAAAILPPVTALSPSPSQQILTPPVKMPDSSRPAP